jgi:hypothetical protein
MLLDTLKTGISSHSSTISSSNLRFLPEVLHRCQTAHRHAPIFIK